MRYPFALGLRGESDKTITDFTASVRHKINSYEILFIILLKRDKYKSEHSIL